MRLIDADKFIEWLDVGHLRNPSEICLSELNVLKMIIEQPTVDKWIPCKERLPDKQGEYLTFIESEGKTCYDISMYDCYSWNYTENCSVLAWMPLPEPYKESE